jgi:TRAP-type mannitol/chloroaromatic compound transport system permease small subunit
MVNMRLLSAAGRAFGKIVFVSNWLASLWIFGLMALVVSDVSMRYLFNAPIAGVNEIMEISIVAMLYMQVTQALRDERHTRSAAFFTLVMSRSPRAAHLLNACFHTAGLLLMMAVLFGAVPRVLEAYKRGYTVGTRGIFIAPEWPVRLIIVYGSTLMAVQFAILALAAFRAHLGAARKNGSGLRPGREKDD